jgi:hypothetical protein
MRYILHDALGGLSVRAQFLIYAAATHSTTHYAINTNERNKATAESNCYQKIDAQRRGRDINKFDLQIMSKYKFL